jgi:hypothetical protein
VSRRLQSPTCTFTSSLTCVFFASTSNLRVPNIGRVGTCVQELEKVQLCDICRKEQLTCVKFLNFVQPACFLIYSPVLLWVWTVYGVIIVPKYSRKPTAQGPNHTTANREHCSFCSRQKETRTFLRGTKRTQLRLRKFSTSIWTCTEEL